MIRLFLTLETLLFLGAASLHFGLLAKGHEHSKARIAELIIALVLLAGLVFTFIQPANQLQIGRMVQGFALFGTAIGIFTIIIGVGPRSVPDYILHTCMVILLVWGLFYVPA